MNNSEKIKITFIQIGQHVQKLREERNMSIKELSEKTGIRKEYLRKIEQGIAYGVLLEKHFSKIANAFNLKLSELFNY